ncbi:MAG: sulfotransferase [Actinobacteria bacterium]|nr:sulfotransferase [Actinomycetota bacterium]
MTTPVFLIGSGRSGSTLVHEVLARHPDFAFVSNVEDRARVLPPAASRYNNFLWYHIPPSLTRKERLRFAPSEAYRVLAQQVSPMLADSVRDLVASDAMPWVAQRFRSFFLERARVQNKEFILHKFTGWPRTGFIHAVFPDARFIHIVRDGRAVVASSVKLSWWTGYSGPEHLHIGPLCSDYEAEWERSGRSFPLLAGLSWKTMMDAHAAAKRLIPPAQWLDIRYEDFVSDPGAYSDAMLDFVGLEAVERFRAGLARTTVVGERRDAWRRELDATSIGLLDSSLEEHLKLWGYA